MALKGLTLRHNKRMPKSTPMHTHPARIRSVVALVAWSAVLLSPALHAQDGKPVYRCPGPPVLYTDALSAQEARDKGCRTIEGTPITIISSPPRPKPPISNGAAASRPGDSRVDPAAQRARDSDARRILSDELKREEDRLAALQTDYNNGEPERRGDERNFAKYQERVADLKAGIQRKQDDIAAIKREIAKLPQ